MTEKYILPVGKTDLKRMSLLGSIYMPANMQFLLAHGLRKGMTVADVGCGPGNMALWLAEEVGPEGTVIAVDNSEEQIAILEERIREQGIKNIRTKIANIYEIHTLNQKFDFIFCRFVLLHLAHPLQAIMELKKILVPGGKLVACDLDNKTWFAYPPNKSLQVTYCNFLASLGKINGGDLRIGPKLYGLLKKAGFQSVEAEVVHPVLNSYEHKEYLVLRILACAPHYIKHGIAAKKELEDLQEKMQKLIEDDNNLIVAAKMFEVIGTNGEGL